MALPLPPGELPVKQDEILARKSSIEGYMSLKVLALSIMWWNQKHMGLIRNVLGEVDIEQDIKDIVWNVNYQTRGLGLSKWGVKWEVPRPLGDSILFG